ncbi:hypothetical protein [Trinickia fusca]|uniref:Uncharacterized protein n=1 Tax=Trinickia fusca TaxID=2419777 RepID=A0A494X917_9BURK|nr:hypothetical protein [Trinickia fusca]RKP46111.1 hypothetical protein D7S89_19135 [Trinickia fusca]
MVRARTHWWVVGVAGVLVVAVARWRLAGREDREPVAATVRPAVLVDHAPPLSLPPPPLPSRPLGKALPPVKVKAGGTTWSPNPAVAPPSTEAQRGAPDIPGAQPLRPPPSSSE